MTLHDFILVNLPVLAVIGVIVAAIWYLFYRA